MSVSTFFQYSCLTERMDQQQAYGLGDERLIFNIFPNGIGAFTRLNTKPIRIETTPTLAEKTSHLPTACRDWRTGLKSHVSNDHHNTNHH